MSRRGRLGQQASLLTDRRGASGALTIHPRPGPITDSSSSSLTFACALALGGCLGFGEKDEGAATRADGATFEVAEHQPFAEPRELRSRGGELAATLTVGEGRSRSAATR